MYSNHLNLPHQNYIPSFPFFHVPCLPLSVLTIALSRERGAIHDQPINLSWSAPSSEVDSHTEKVSFDRLISFSVYDGSVKRSADRKIGDGRYKTADQSLLRWDERRNLGTFLVRSPFSAKVSSLLEDQIA